MDMSSAKWFSEMEMRGSNFLISEQLQRNSDSSIMEFDDSLGRQELNVQQYVIALEEDGLENKYCYSEFNPESNDPMNTSCRSSSFQMPFKQLKNIDAGKLVPEASPLSSLELLYSSSELFNNSRSEHDCGGGGVEMGFSYSKNNCGEINFASSNGRAGTKRPSAWTNNGNARSQSQHHIVAERKRREKLTRRFIALSAIIPGLKKKDKASIIEHAIKHLRGLQERLQLLEERANPKSSEMSVVLVKKSRVSMNETSSFSGVENPNDNEALPEIEARVSEKNVLIRIHCEKEEGMMLKILKLLEKLHLTVVSSSVLPFSNHAMDMTVVAQMNAEYCVTLKDLLGNLRLAFQDIKERA